MSHDCEQNATERIDNVFAVPDGQGRTPAVLASDVVMDYREETSGACLWPSDHNGVISTFDLRALQSSVP